MKLNQIVRTSGQPAIEREDDQARRDEEPRRPDARAREGGAAPLRLVPRRDADLGNGAAHAYCQPLRLIRFRSRSRRFRACAGSARFDST